MMALPVDCPRNGPAAGRRTVDTRDDGLVHLAYRRDDFASRFDEVAERLPILLLEQFAHVSDIGAGTEGPSGAGNHQDPYVLVLGCMPHDGGQLLSHLAGKCVELTGSVERDDANLAVFPVDHVLGDSHARSTITAIP